MWTILLITLLASFGHAVEKPVAEEELAPNIFRLAQNLETLAPKKIEAVLKLAFKSCEEDPTAAIEFCALKKNYKQWRIVYEWLTQQSQYNLDTTEGFENYLVEIRPEWQELDLQTISWSFSIAADISDETLVRDVVKKILIWSVLKKSMALRLLEFKTRFQQQHNYPSMTTYSLVFPLITAWASSPIPIKQLWTLSQSIDCRKHSLCIFQKRALENMVCSEAHSFRQRSQDVISALRVSHVLYDSSVKELANVLDLQNEYDTALNQVVWNVLEKVDIRNYVLSRNEDVPSFDISEELFLKIKDRATLPLSDEDFIKKSFIGVQVQTIQEVAQLCPERRDWADADQKRLNQYKGAQDMRNLMHSQLDTSLKSFESVLAGLPMELQNVE